MAGGARAPEGGVLDGGGDARGLAHDVPPQAPGRARPAGVRGPAAAADQLLVPLGPRHGGRCGRRGGAGADHDPGPPRLGTSGRHGRHPPGRAGGRGRPDPARRAQPVRCRRRRRRGRVLGARRRRRLRPVAPGAADRGVQQPRADESTARRGAQPDQGRGRPGLQGAAGEAGGRVRVEQAVVARDDHRGPRPGDGRAGRHRRRRPRHRVWGGRHRADRVRRAGRNRHPGRRAAGRDRQPAGPQPRRAPLPPGRHGCRPQRAGPGDRPGPDHWRRHRRGRALPGDGRNGLRRGDHGRCERGDQGKGRLAGLCPLGAAEPDVPGRAARGLGGRRPLDQAPGPHGRGRERRLLDRRDALAARRGDRRRHPRHRPAAPQPVPVLDPARPARAEQGQAHRRAGEPDDRPQGRASVRRATPRASSTATRSGPAGRCTPRCCTAGCWSASRADPPHRVAA